MDGWTDAGETWTYASADDPTFTFTISGDKTSKYSAGMRVRLTQTTAKYFLITAVSYSAPNTTVTVYGGTDYDLANAAITSPYYSVVRAPQGFPLDPTKWTVEVTDTGSNSQATPSAATWYNLGSVSITIPIGVWHVSYRVICELSGTANSRHFTTLSTANNSESNNKLTYGMYAGSNPNGASFSVREVLNLSSKTVYYLNASFEGGSPTALSHRGDVKPTIIRAVSAYF